MDHLREGIGLRGYGSRDPKIEYKREAHQLFNSLTREVDFNVCAELFNVQLMSPEEARAQQERQRRAAEQMARMAQMRGAGSGGSDQADSVRPAAAAAKKPGNADRLVKGRPRYRKTSKKEKRAKRR
jgi:preprotein translocase subunit SecA